MPVRIEVGREYLAPLGASKRVRVKVLGVYADGDLEIVALEAHKDNSGKKQKAGEEYSYSYEVARGTWVDVPPAPQSPVRPRPVRTPHVVPPTLNLRPRPPAPSAPPPPPPSAPPTQPVLPRTPAHVVPPSAPPPPPQGRPVLPRTPGHVRPPSSSSMGPLPILRPRPPAPPASGPRPVTREQVRVVPKRRRAFSKEAKAAAKSMGMRLDLKAGQVNAMIKQIEAEALKQGFELPPGEDSTEYLVKRVVEMIQSPRSAKTIDPEVPRQTVERVAEAPVPSLARRSFPPPPAGPPAPHYGPAPALDPQPEEVWEVNDGGTVFEVLVERVHGHMVEGMIPGHGNRVMLPRALFVRRLNATLESPYF